MPVEPGLTGNAHLVVSEADTAIAIGSGDVPVLATPRVVALAEQASVAALAGFLDDAETTVGYRVQIDHLAPTAVGEKVTADATLEAVDGRRLVFRVAVNDEHSLVAAGRVTRVLVDRARFLDKLC